MHMWDGGGTMGLMMIGWLLTLAIVVVAGWFLIGLGRSRGTGESAEEVLKKRYARGEMDKETYERMLEDLRR